MRVFWIVSLVVLLGGYSPGYGVEATPATGPVVTGFEPFDQAVPAFLRKWQIPGASVAVAYQGKIVFARGYGYADPDAKRLVRPDTSFRIMSCSKMLTASLTLKLVEEGRLSLDDHAFELLAYPTPSYAGARRDSRLDLITVRQLLSHTAGWVSDQATDPLIGGRGFYPILQQLRIAQAMGEQTPASAETVIRYLVGQPLQADPGTVYRYTNQDFLTLGRLIEKKTGVTYEKAIQDFLAGSYISNFSIAGSRRADLADDEAVYFDYAGAPLVMSQFDGQYAPQPYAYYLRGWDAAGGWKTSAIECLRFLLALDGRNGTPQLLKTDSVTAMRTVCPPATSYGFGWFTSGASYASDDSGHGGGSWGTKTWAIRTSDGNWDIVLFLNSIPGEAFSGVQFETDGRNVLHALPSGFVPPDIDMTWTTLGWDGWQRLYFEGSSTTETADTDNDGVPDLIEYSAGLDPTSADPLPPAVFEERNDGTTLLTYRRILLEHPLRWTVSSSRDGKTWSDVSTTPSVSGPNIDGTLSVAVSMGDARYARLTVRRVASEAEATYEMTVEPAPVFTTQPSNTVVMEGNSASLSVFASGLPAPTYQWQVRTSSVSAWANISTEETFLGRDSKTLQVIKAALSMNGWQVRCIAKNSAGEATSEAATLSVTAASSPQFTVQPNSQTVNVGTTVTLSCAAVGGTVTYQWKKNGNDLAGATTASLKLSDVTLADGGAYSVVATNSAGSTTSNTAQLVVNQPDVHVPPASTGGGGGGGAVSWWALILLAALGSVRAVITQQRRR